MIVRLIIFYFFVCMVGRAQMNPPDVQISLRRINLLDGKTVWSFPFDRKLRPYRCEVYTNGVVTFLYPVNGMNGIDSEVVFLSPKFGQKITPFDTRDFIWPEDDPRIACSGSRGSVEEERSEISLPNGWRSHGAAGLSWRNSGSNNVYFFRGSLLQWSMTLPDGAYNLSHWKNILVYSRTTEKEKTLVDTLYAQPAGKDFTTWNFSLPADIPSAPWQGPDFISDKMIRSFSYTVGKKYVFVFGGGMLFALDPQTGKLMWHHLLSNDPILKENAVSIGNAEILEGVDEVFLFSGSTLVCFKPSLMSVTALLRKDLYEGLPPIVIDGSIYCFTQQH